MNIHCVTSWFFFHSLHPLPPPLKQFLFLSFPSPLWLQVKETTANHCWIQHFPSSPLEWIAVCSRILEKYANFISRRMAYSSCFCWNESAVRKPECMSVVPFALPMSLPLSFRYRGLHYMRIHLGPSCMCSEFQVTSMTIYQRKPRSPISFFFFNLWLSHQVLAPRCIHLLAQEKKEAFISCLSSSRWLCFEKNSENMLISLRNGPVMAPSINRAQASTAMY